MAQNKEILKVDTGFTWHEQRMAVQTALILGFQAEAAVFPIASRKTGMKIPETVEVLRQLLPGRSEAEVMPAGYTPASAAAKPVPEFDWREKKGLEAVFGLGAFLKDDNLDLLPDRLDFQLVLPRESSVSLVIAACNLAFRFGMETTGIDGWLAVPEYRGGNALILREAQDCRMYFQEEAGDQVVCLEGSGQELEEFSAQLCETFPQLGHFDTWARRLQEMTDSFAMRNLDGQLSYLKAWQESGETITEAYVSPEIETRPEVKQLFPQVTFHNYKAMKPAYEREYDIPWEVDQFRKVIQEQVCPLLKQGDRVEILGAVSETKAVRAGLTKAILEELSGRQVQAEKVQVLCAYKQGFSWIDELVLPQLERAGTVQKVQIAFRPFLPEGVTEWNDENGATPAYNNTDKAPERWYDLPIRYLQELYPVRDIMVRRLKLEPGQIEFTLYEGSEDITYELTAWDAGEQEIYRGSYLAAAAERPYLDEFPELGKVHPATGYVAVKVNGDEVLFQKVKTDLEMIWDIYQSQVLADCRRFIEDKAGGSIKAGEQPFFSQLRLEIAASEPDERLDSREDMISALDALHEDLYFAGADYFKNYGLKVCKTMLEEPGLILPVIKKGDGKPVFKVTLFEQMAERPGIVCDGQVRQDAPNRSKIALYIREIAYRNQQWSVTVKADGISPEAAKAYMELAGQGAIVHTRELGLAEWLVLEADGEQYQVRAAKGAEDHHAPLAITEIDLLEDTLIGYEQYLKIIAQLKRVSGIAVYRTAVSYLGREIYAIELLPRAKGYISRTKRITNYPSEIINARHHANEVSGTNAAFILLKRLLSDPAYAGLADRLNLVIVPMENVDGAAIHYQLQQDNPYWKLHVARFNAVGKEFYHEHFKADTKHTEALGLTRLFETFLPDIIVDNHGVPSHEWEQQFSGYTSPSFKGFWLPRSLLYGYFWVVNDEAYKSNYTVNKKMEDVIAKAIGADAEMKRWNQEWAEQFEAYAHKWMPKLFPADYYKGMINYWIPFAADQNHRYPSIRFPWITTVAYTSEVADETAQGEYLNLCARAHVTHDLATIDMLTDARCIYENKAVMTADTMKICRTRIRPIIV